uniref:MalT-like TPR region domain-containing protein n=1 Tax=Anopheles culicifacies TaxID=139723 RepID=A0A182LVR1_9DIPT
MSSQSLVRPGLTTPYAGSLPEIKLRLRKKVPKLTANDVRRARIPYYEAIASELYEDGFVNAAFLLLHLIEYEDANVGRTSYVSVESRRLRNSEKLLNYLGGTLANAESCKRDQRYDREVSELLAIARKLEPDHEKRWLARQFFMIALDRCIDCEPKTRVKIQSLVRFYFAKFQIDQKRHLEAMLMLEQADAELESQCDAALVDDWKTLEEDGESLSIAVNTLLFVCNRKLAEETGASPAWIAEQYIRDAHKAALKTFKTSIMAESYQAYGDFLSRKGCHEEALEMYRNGLQQAELDGGMQDLACSVGLAQATSYHKLGQMVKCDAMLRRVDRMTKSTEQSLNRGHYYLTSATLRQEDAKADPAQMDQLMSELRLAVNIFDHFRRMDKSLEARCLEGLLRAEPMFKEYISLLPTAFSTSDDALYRVIDRVGF